MNPRTPAENDLLAYVDDQLDESQRQWVEQYLAKNPVAARQVADWRADTQRLRIALTRDESLPEMRHLQPPVIRRHLRARRQLRWALACTLVLSLSGGGVAGWHLKDMAMHRQMLPMEDAVHAYQLFSQDKLPVLDVVAGNRGEMNNWLSRYFINGLMPPNLDEYGFKMMGGRLMVTDLGPAALVVYQDAQGVRVAYYIRPAGQMSPKSGKREAGKLLAQYWSDNNYSYAIVSPVKNNRTEPVQKAIAAYTTAPRAI